MKKNKIELCLFFILMTMMVSCHKNAVLYDRHFAHCIYDYYNKTCRYPKDGNDFCYHIYMYEKINKVIDGDMSYKDFCEKEENEMAYLKQDYKTPIFQYPYFFLNRENISFKSSDSFLFMRNRKSKDVYAVPLIDGLLKHFGDSVMFPSYNVDASLNPGAFGRDSIKIEWDTYQSDSIMTAKIYALYENWEKYTFGNKVQMVYYDKAKNMNKGSCPEQIRKDSVLVGILDDILNYDKRIKFIRFAITIDK